MQRQALSIWQLRRALWIDVEVERSRLEISEGYADCVEKGRGRYFLIAATAARPKQDFYFIHGHTIFLNHRIGRGTENELSYMKTSLHKIQPQIIAREQIYQR
jgi:hypothetical protein